MQNGKYTKEQLLNKLDECLKTHETTNFDFKREWSDKIDKTVCSMLNIIGNNDDAFIFIGIDDKTRKIVGTAIKDENHFNAYKFNIKPNINIDTIQKDGKNIQIISIWNRYDKPYFQVNGAGQMNSVIMTRNNSASVSATPQEIEELYKYRFRIDEDIKTKIFRSLLTDIRNWHCEFIRGVYQAYYLKDPNYKIVGMRSKIDNQSTHTLDICYNNTVITNSLLYAKDVFFQNRHCVIPCFLPEHFRVLYGIHYNVTLLLSMAFGDTNNAPRRTIENFRETFEKACEENGIIWK
jgi:predicted HTH transcriptional regulator